MPEDVQIGEVTSLHFGTGDLHGRRRCVRACKAYDLMPRAKQLTHHSRANEAACSRDEDAHVPIMRKSLRLSQIVDR